MVTRMGWADLLCHLRRPGRCWRIGAGGTPSKAMVSSVREGLRAGPCPRLIARRPRARRASPALPYRLHEGRGPAVFASAVGPMIPPPHPPGPRVLVPPNPPPNPRRTRDPHVGSAPHRAGPAGPAQTVPAWPPQGAARPTLWHPLYIY